jgi:hypothetical protein
VQIYNIVYTLYNFGTYFFKTLGVGWPEMLMLKQVVFMRSNNLKQKGSLIMRIPKVLSGAIKLEQRFLIIEN